MVGPPKSGSFKAPMSSLEIYVAEQADLFDPVHQLQSEISKTLGPNSAPSVIGMHIYSFEVDRLGCLSYDICLEDQFAVLKDREHPSLVDPASYSF